MALEMMPKPTVFIVDDDQAIRDSLSQLVRCMGLQEETYATARVFLTALDPSRPGCLVTDIRMPGMSGIDLQQELLADAIKLPIIFISGHGDVRTSVRAMKSGAVDFLEKPYRPRQLQKCIHSAIKLDAKLRAETVRQEEIEASFAQLDKEELAVMEGVVSGQLIKVIASRLEVSRRTVEMRLASLMKKLRVDSRAALIGLALSAKDARQAKQDAFSRRNLRPA